MQTIDVNDHRLTAPERQTLRTIAMRLEGGAQISRPPSEYQAQAEAMFRPCDEGDTIPATPTWKDAGVRKPT
jgi:hypothetical protein